MRMHFTLVIRGKENLEKKFEEAISQHPNLHMDLIRSFGQTIMTALRLNDSDEITIESFRAGKIADEPSTEPKEEKVVN